MVSKYSISIHVTMGTALVLQLLWGTIALGQLNPRFVRDDDIALASERIDNSKSEPITCFVGTVSAPGAPTMRIHFGNYELGRSSFVTLTSVADDAVQRLDARTLPDSYDWSAAFVGDSVEVELHVAPGDAGVFVEIDKMRTPEMSEQDGGDVASICGANDDRAPSFDARVGRVSSGGAGGAYCTAWLISNGAVLTAGHCIPTAGDFVEFGVPATLANGIDLPASPLNQYPINIGSVVSENSGVGQDWMVFRVNANTTTGRTAHNLQGFFRMTNTIPANGTVLRVTGYGIDSAPAGTGTAVCVGGPNQNTFCVNNANCPGGLCAAAPCCDPDGTGPSPCGNNCNSASQTQQTTTGTLASSNVNLISHNVDTMPGNSGSPIIWEQNGLTVGIHTAGGCAASGPGSNAGTRFSRTALGNAIHNFAGPNPVYVDTSDYDFPANGGVFEPFHNIMPAIGAVLDNGTISLVPGFFMQQNGGNPIVIGADGKGMTIVSPAGSSFIGS